MLMGELRPWLSSHEQWIGFHAAMLALLVVELLFSRAGMKQLEPAAKVKRQKKNAVAATVMWIAAALGFAVYLLHAMGGQAATQFLAGYALEESLSIDNLFVFLLLFRVFKIADVSQPRVLFWGVLGAIVMRGTFIALGIGLLQRFEWVSYVFAVVLLIAAVRLVLPEKEGRHEEARTPTWVRWISKIRPVSMRHDRFFVKEDGRQMVTMLFLSLIAIETADIVFALDSIPAVLSITRNPFLAYTSNILAVMGLRSLFFLLAEALKKLRYLHYGLAGVLAFAAGKMLLEPRVEIGPLPSLGVIVAILGVTIAVSLIYQRPVVEG